MFQANESVPVNDLIRLNNELRKAANVGYQVGATTSGGDAGTLSPLVPQSIEPMLASATFTLKQLALWPDIPKKDVTQTLHEYVRIEEHGGDLDPFFGEGSVPGTNRSEYTRESVRIKYMAERREVTDVATMVGLIGANPNAVAEETERGTHNLMRRVEHALWHADSSINPEAFDGIFKQVETNAPNSVYDLDGASITASLLHDILGEMSAAPYYSEPDTIYMEPRVHQELIKSTVAHGRHDQLAVVDSSKVTFGTQQISIMGPYGAVPVKPAPFIHTSFEAPAAAAGDSGSLPSTPDTADPGGVAIASNPGAGNFVAADAGNYIYKIIAVSAKGHSAPFTTAATAVVAGDVVTFTIGTPPAGATPIYYRIYRSAKGGAASTCRWIANVAYVGPTPYTDTNAAKPNTSKVWITKKDPGIFQFVKLLDFMRRPLAEVQTTKPFLLMLFGAPIVKVPTKTFVIKNVGTNSVLV